MLVLTQRSKIVSRYTLINYKGVSDMSSEIIHCDRTYNFIAGRSMYLQRPTRP